MSDPRPYWHQSPYRGYYAQHHFRAGWRPRAPKWVPVQGRASGWSPRSSPSGQFCRVLCSRSSRPPARRRSSRSSTRARWGSTALRGADCEVSRGSAAPLTQRNVMFNPFLIRTGIHTMMKLILALTIHDQDGHHGQASMSDHHCLDRTYPSI